MDCTLRTMRITSIISLAPTDFIRLEHMDPMKLRASPGEVFPSHLTSHSTSDMRPLLDLQASIPLMSPAVSMKSLFQPSWFYYPTSSTSAAAPTLPSLNRKGSPNREQAPHAHVNQKVGIRNAGMAREMADTQGRFPPLRFSRTVSLSALSTLDRNIVAGGAGGLVFLALCRVYLTKIWTVEADIGEEELREARESGADAVYSSSLYVFLIKFSMVWWVL